MKTVHDLTFDVFRFILSYLSLEDLLNLCIANKYLREMAMADLRLKFGGKRVLALENLTRCDPRLDLSCNGERLSLRSLKLSLIFLRIFGSNVKRLLINGLDVQSRDLLFVGKYIEKYCKGLDQIHFIYLTCDISRSFENSFEKIVKISFTWCYIGRRLSRLIHWFPNMESLEFYYWNKIGNSNELVVKYAYLRRVFAYVESLNYDLCQKMAELNLNAEVISHTDGENFVISDFPF